MHSSTGGGRHRASCLEPAGVPRRSAQSSTLEEAANPNPKGQMRLLLNICLGQILHRRLWECKFQQEMLSLLTDQTSPSYNYCSTSVAYSPSTPLTETDLPTANQNTHSAHPHSKSLAFQASSFLLSNMIIKMPCVATVFLFCVSLCPPLFANGYSLGLLVS